MRAHYDDETGVLAVGPPPGRSPVVGIDADRYGEILGQIARARRLTPTQIFEATAKHVRRWLKARRDEERAVRG